MIEIRPGGIKINHKTQKCFIICQFCGKEKCSNVAELYCSNKGEFKYE